MRSDLPRLRAELEWVFRQFQGEHGLYYRDLSTGAELGIAAGESFPAGSNVKVAILVELLRRLHQGEVRLEERLPVEAASVVEGSGLLRHMTLPALPTVRDLALLMITVSDNVATNLLIERIGLPSVNRLLDELGFPSIRLNRLMQDWEARREGRDNLCSARELGAFLAALWSGELLPPESTVFALELLKKTTDKSRLRFLLPRSVEIAHKPGTGDGFENDAGIVFAGERPYLLVVLNRNVARAGEGSQAVALASGFVYRHHTGERVPLLELLPLSGGG